MKRQGNLLKHTISSIDLEKFIASWNIVSIASMWIWNAVKLTFFTDRTTIIIKYKCWRISIYVALKMTKVIYLGHIRCYFLPELYFAVFLPFLFLLKKLSETITSLLFAFYPLTCGQYLMTKPTEQTDEKAHLTMKICISEIFLLWILCLCCSDCF